jgi:two-component system response regulator GlrR
MPKRVMLVDDDEVFIEDIRFQLGDRFEWVVLTDGQDVFRTLRESMPDVVLLDIDLPGPANGLDLLPGIREELPRTPVIMVTRYDPEDFGNEAWARGASGYISKSAPTEALAVKIADAVETATLRREKEILARGLRREKGRLTGRSSPMRKVMEDVRVAASGDCTVLITGETGTGKDVAAFDIHYLSRRREKPFFAFNARGVQDSVIESELFGHVKGAFSGAVRNREGYFSAAAGGTIFLNEIGELDTHVQSKLLEVLESPGGGTRRRFLPVGSSMKKEVDVRVIAATNVDLEAAVGEGRFREDLFFRLRVMHIRMPPLRDRREDLPLLTQDLLDRLAESQNRPRCRVSSGALGALQSHDWPGNVRELKNVLEAAMVRTREPVLTEDFIVPQLVASAPRPRYSGTLQEATDAFTRDYVTGVLEEEGWNRTAAARRLDRTREGLRRLMRRLGITPPDTERAGS